ncbi:hypothetical protein MKW94_009680 [Papaver nudicaule]|uniref:Uncharacterized protein n=1 Tax=Papaver nudicaule TaxID=74823 RepID=A0AA41SIP7_PAPNU|nr:hypothetical protein [Papaver nudicaule]MCL7049430.1 hypothetical protein [Papaver nudicaule]
MSRRRLQPPSLLSLAIESGVRNISRIPDLSSLPDHIVFDLFQGTVREGKLNDKILKVFIATDNKEVLTYIQRLGIKRVVLPVLPTRCSGKFEF